jgi:predicted nucleic acid-binding protein
MAMTLAGQVPDGGTVLIDTNPIIYVLEGNPLGAPFRSIFEAVDDGRIRALVTPITVAEVVTGPLKANRDALAERYRRRHALKLPDAFQLAVALEEGCSALVTHDRDFSTVSDILVLGTARRSR